MQTVTPEERRTEICNLAESPLRSSMAALGASPWLKRMSAGLRPEEFAVFQLNPLSKRYPRKYKAGYFFKA